jgi:alpha-ribazole phosphatase/probable phosphoglycerate mutase
MLTKLYLIRHGETEGAETRRYKGHIDVPLSENGIRQIKKLSEHIIENSSPGLSSVYCSDLSRAVKSAEIIAEQFGVKPVILKDLKERNFGVWEGMSFEEIEEKYPHDFKAWAENPLKFSPLNGETTVEVRDRAMRALDRILKKNKGEEIAVVSHGGIIRIILCELLGIPLENIFRIEQDFAALNIIEFWEMYPVVKLINYVHTIKNI